MAVTAPEFSRPVRLDTIGDRERTIAVEADAAERAALAGRFGLVRLDVLTAETRVVRDGETVSATGSLSAHLVQACVATGEDVPQAIAAPFALRFVPETADDAPEEIELDERDLDTIGYEGGAIDLGEAVAQTLALAIDPFPRAPDADATLRAAGVLGEDQAGPFAKLLDLKDRLAGKG